MDVEAPGIATFIMQASYFAACALFILGLRSLTNVETARRGMQQAALGMLLAVVGTLLHRHILTYQWILVGLVVGSLLGYPLGKFVPMTAMPQRIAFSHMFGALAATLVGVAEVWHAHERAVTIDSFRMGAFGFEVLFGALTVTGSFMAFGKLQGFIPGRPITYPLQNVSNAGLFGLAAACFVYLLFQPGAVGVFLAMTLIAFAIGILLVLPIGGADMPVVISLLNAYAGLAASATGFAIDNNVLIVCGALDGGSGFLLSIVMSKGMNRSFRNVLFGAFGTGESAPAEVVGTTDLPIHAISVEDAALRLGYAKRVIVVPGYGLAVSQAQHEIRTVADLIEANGGEVKYAIHPVAGRMPGHMNVLLAEADVPYDHLYDMDEINDQFASTDVTLIVGANDVVNPAARTDRSSPIYGMPILSADESKSIIVLKRSMNPGFSGIENELFHNERTSMLFGDAKKSLAALANEIKQL